MNRLPRILVLITAALILLIGCAGNSDTSETTTFVKLDGVGADYTISRGGTYSLSGTLDGGKVKVEADSDVTLLLSGVEITNESDEAISIENEGTTTIKTAGGSVNNITGCKDAAISAKSSIVFDGSGTLNISGTQKHGIACDGDITIKGGTINVSSYEHGIKSEAVITLLDGNIDITAQTGKGIKAEKKFLSENGNVKINSIEDEGLESKGELTINGGNFDITAGEDGINAGTSDSTSEAASAVVSPDTTTHLAPDYTDATTEGGEGTGAIPPESAQPDRLRPERRFPIGGEGEQTIPDANASQNTERPQIPEGEFKRPEGKIPPSDFKVPEGATTSGRGIPFEHERTKGEFGTPGKGGGIGKVNADSVLTINGGTIRINCLGDGIDSNGTLSINGGVVIIDGPENSGNGPLDSDGEMLINNATVLTASSRGMTQLPRSMTQGILTIIFDSPLSVGDEIVIMDSNDKIITEHKAGRISEMLMFTSPDISENEQYTVYINGEEYSVITPESSVPNGFKGINPGGGGFRQNTKKGAENVLSETDNA